MEVTKIGESFTIKDVRDSYKIEGDITKTVAGDALITVNVSTLEGEFITSLRGDFRTTDGKLSLDFRTDIDKYESQLEITTNVLDCVKTILNA